VIAIYHDQGQIATKLKGFNRGVTVTAGLEAVFATPSHGAVFATPSHGTAFDIVGKGVARTGALENAIRLAAQLAHIKLREDSYVTH
jgi:4-hydroxy-L-threonine phosphate dehydrogenase PdxA